MIDLYRRWDPILRVKFKFWDTVGDLRFISSIVECMRQSEVIVALYRLSYSAKQVAKSVEFIIKIDRLIHNILLDGSKKRKNKKNGNNDNDDDENMNNMANSPSDVSIKTMHGEEFELEDKWNIKFGCMVIGICTQPLSKTLWDKHFETLSYLERKCSHLKFIIPHAFYINYYMDGMPRMVTLLETLVDIQKMKKQAIAWQYINNPRCCCNLLTSFKPMYDFPTKISVKSQPFVLRKVQSIGTTMKALRSGGGGGDNDDYKDYNHGGVDVAEMGGFKKHHIGSSQGMPGDVAGYSSYNNNNNKRHSKIVQPTRTQQAYYSMSNVFGPMAGNMFNVDNGNLIPDEHHHHHGKEQYRHKKKITPNKVVAGPIASVHHWRLTRPKLLIATRFGSCLISGIFFPFLVVFQVFI